MEKNDLSLLLQRLFDASASKFDRPHIIVSGQKVSGQLHPEKQYPRVSRGLRSPATPSHQSATTTAAAATTTTAAIFDAQSSGMFF